MTVIDPRPEDWDRPSSATGGRSRQPVIVALASAVVLVLLVAATNSVVGAARTISTDAANLSETDEVIRAATVARTLAVLAAVTVNEGDDAPSTDEIFAAVAVLERRPDPAVDRLAIAVRAVTADFEAIAAAPAGAGDVGPDPALIAALENQFGDAFALLSSQRQELASTLARSEDQLGRISTMAGIALLFAVPTLAIFVYRGLTRPANEQAAAAHAAALQGRRDRRRRHALTDAVAQLRTLLDRSAPAPVVAQHLDELTALAGVGSGGEIRRRERVDLPTALAAAVRRSTIPGAVPVQGDRCATNGDPDQVVVLLAAVLDSATAARDHRIDVDSRGSDPVVTISVVGPWPAETTLAPPAIWDIPDRGDVSPRLVAARLLARDLGVGIRATDIDGRLAVELTFPAADEPVAPDDDPAPSSRRTWVRELQS